MSLLSWCSKLSWFKARLMNLARDAAKAILLIRLPPAPRCLSAPKFVLLVHNECYSSCTSSYFVAAGPLLTRTPLFVLVDCCLILTLCDCYYLSRWLRLRQALKGGVRLTLLLHLCYCCCGGWSVWKLGCCFVAPLCQPEPPMMGSWDDFNAHGLGSTRFNYLVQRLIEQFHSIQFVWAAHAIGFTSCSWSAE